MHNRGTDTAVLYVRHTVPSGWTLRTPPTGTERYGDDALVPVRVRAGMHLSLSLTEAMPIQTAFDLHTPDGAITAKAFIESGRAPEPLVRQLEVLVAAHDTTRKVSDELLTARERAAALRTRVNELRKQLTLLRKVKQARSLSSELAERMREVSHDLDAALLAVSELENEHLEARIQLSSRVADLSLEHHDDEVAVRE